MPIRITAKQNGYCRCNTVFSDKPTDYPDGHFTAPQLAQLKADPGLHVVVGAVAVSKEFEASQEAAAAAAAQIAKDMEKNMTVAQLVEKLNELKVSIPAGAKKADLITLLMDAEK